MKCYGRYSDERIKTDNYWQIEVSGILNSERSQSKLVKSGDLGSQKRVINLTAKEYVCLSLSPGFTNY